MSSRKSRILKSFGIVIAAIVIGAVGFVWISLESSLPPTTGVISGPAVSADVKITYDSMGIAQIWAVTEQDALFALGWLHASDRMFQMDLTRRFSQGRLSEAFGSMMLDLDTDQRRIGHVQLAREAQSAISSENRTKLEAYVSGINGYRTYGSPVPFEFRLLPIEFETWGIVDCLSILSFQMWFSDALQNRDEFLAKMVIDGYGNELRDLPLSYPSWGPSTVYQSQSSGSPDGIFKSPGRYVAEDIVRTGAARFSATYGSNAWVVAPERSESGEAILCSDPHLEITRLPGMWYYVGMHIEETEMDVMGVTIPGLPFFVMGHNGKAAWAFTAAGVDVTDYYREGVDPDDSSRYLETIDPSRGADSLVWREFYTVEDSISVSGQQQPVVETFRYTSRGPLVPDWDDGEYVYSERWAGRDVDFNEAVGSGFELAEVDSIAQFRRVVTSVGALDASWMYADAGGTIGYQLGTPVPIRGNSASPDAPLEGWNSAHQWQGYREHEEVPWAEDPDRGWLGSCNNQPGQTGDIAGNYAVDRILRLEELLRSQERFSVEDMYRFQMDLTDSFRARWTEVIAGLTPDVNDTVGVLESVAGWDGSCDTGSGAVGLVTVFVDELRDEIFADELGAKAAAIGRLTTYQVWFGESGRWIDDITTADTVESRQAVGARALQRAVDMCGAKRWGEMQTLVMQHPMATVPVVGSLLGLDHGPWPYGGSPGTLNASYHQRLGEASFSTIVGPSLRFVVDFSDIDAATMVLPAGNSGNPMSPHFFDFNEMWRKGERWNVPLSREKVFDRAISVLTLRSAEATAGG